MWTRGLSRTSWLTGAQSRATRRIAGSSSTTSTRSMDGHRAEPPGGGAGAEPDRPAPGADLEWRAAPMSPPMTCVAASPRAFPSILPLRSRRRSRPLPSGPPTLLSTPSASQARTRRCGAASLAARWARAFRRSTRPAPIGLWRHAAVGRPRARQEQDARGDAPRARQAPPRRHCLAPARERTSARRPGRAAAAHDHDARCPSPRGAAGGRSRRRASPRCAPAVFQAYARPDVRADALAPRARAARSAAETATPRRTPPAGRRGTATTVQPAT